MKNKNLVASFHFIIVILVIISYSSTIYAAGKKINPSPDSVKVCLLTSKDKYNEEINSAYDFLSRQFTNPSVITFNEIKANKNSIDKFNVIWFHRPDSTEFTNIETDPIILKLIKNYVENGGNLLLTLEALKYLIPLGIETEKPQVRYAEAVDEGYGRKLGLHAFREHPIFNRMFGGAYIFNPFEDQTCRQVGYFEDSIPNNGKVVAIDWSYITFKENSKLLLEYKVGKGRVIAVGAYTHFAPRNYNRAHLEKFLTNSINYLAGNLDSEKKFYWNYTQTKILPLDSLMSAHLQYINIEQVNPPSATIWNLSEDSPKLSNLFASDNYWDVAGQRILIMGREKGGIDEIWAHPFMALRDYEVGIQFSYRDTIYWLNDERPEIEVRPESFTRIYKFRRAYLTEIITPSITDPVGVVHYEYRGVFPARLIIKFKSNFRYMWPYSDKVLGSIYNGWNDDLNSVVLTDHTGDFACIVGANKHTYQHITGQFKDFIKVDSVFAGIETDEFFASALLQFELKMNDNIDIVISAGADGLKNISEHYTNIISQPEKVFEATKKYYTKFLEKSLMITTPDKDFNEGYRWALVGTDRFFVNTPDVGKAFVAGYSTTARGWDGGHTINGRPGYGWYFGRDAEWNCFATLDYGDFEKVKSQLEFFNKYQDISGKIFHELTTSGAVHYDAADSTPLYIILAGKYLRHSGDVDFIKQTWRNIKSAIDYCFSTDTDGDHLIENTNVGHGWVEGGKLYGSHTTLYLASCWAAAIDEACQMVYAMGLEDEAEFYKSESQIVKDIINKDFWNEKENFFYYGKLKNGNYNPEPTVLPAIPLYFKQIDEEKASPVLRRYFENGFTSDWGVRILSEESSLFNPRGYHYGSVWPLFTGWTSLAEYSYGRGIQGFSHIMNNLLVYKNWSLGFVEEVMNGAEYNPSGVCPHQCWSETMVLQPIIEGMLGLEMDAASNEITLSPRLPADWNFINVERIKFGDGEINFKMVRTPGKTIYTFEQSNSQPAIVKFIPTFAPGTNIIKIIIDNETILQPNNKPINLNLTLNKSAKIEIFHTGGISVLPYTSSPKPGYESEGFRIINDSINENIYSIEVQGKSGNSYIMKLFLSDGIIESVDTGKPIGHQDSVYEIEVPFESNEQKYQNKTVRIKFN